MKKGEIFILYKIKNEIETLEKGLVCLENELKGLPGRTLRCTSSNGTDQFFINGKYANKKQMNTIQGIIQREYDEKLQVALKKRLQILRELEKNYSSRELEKCFESLCKARKKHVKPLFKTVEEQIEEFLNEEYEAGIFDMNNTTEFFTRKGERVRSKSEVLISEHLNYYGVPYRYEKPIKLIDWNKVVTCRPDFTVINKRTGKMFLYEHLGKMDDENYVASNMRKLDLYEKNGYLLGESLIITHETSTAPLNIKVVDSYIKTYFL